MQIDGVFVCACGIRLRVVVDGEETGFLPCPNPVCRSGHVVSGRIVEVLIDERGTWSPYDWKASCEPSLQSDGEV